MQLCVCVCVACECAYVGVSHTQTSSLTESSQWAEHWDGGKEEIHSRGELLPQGMESHGGSGTRAGEK